MGSRWHLVPAVLAAALAHGTAVLAHPWCAPEEKASSAAVRLLNPVLTAAFDEGLRDSPTLRALVEQIEVRQALVFVRMDSSVLRQRNLLGATSHRVSHAGDHRVVFISISSGLGVRTIDTIAHELQHVVELLESNATEPGAIAGYYRRIGYQVSPGTFETEMARQTGAQVLEDVLRCRRGAK